MPGERSEGKFRMEFIHAREYLKAGDIVVIECDRQCNVCVMTDSELAKYQAARSFDHLGGCYTQFPVHIIIPDPGYWNVTLDQGGGSVDIRHSISYVKQP